MKQSNRHWPTELKHQHNKLITKLTDQNCARPVHDLANDYASWAYDVQKLETVHVFPAMKTANACSNVTRKAMHLPGIQLITVNIDDY
jgi:hypothetical protein